MNASKTLGWGGIFRLGLVQTALGAIVVLATTTMNRVMVVELGLPAALPAALVAWHYAVQIVRPRLGFGSDVGGRCTPWIHGGIALLGLGAMLAALAIGVMPASQTSGVALALLGFSMIGGGVGAAGTSLLVMLTKRVDERRRAAAATVVWVMMIVGFVVTTAVVGKTLDPYSADRLLTITIAVAGAAFLLALLGVAGVESRMTGAGPASPRRPQKVVKGSFGKAVAEVWSEPRARRFTIFVFVSMLAYSGQELILEPFAGAVFAMTPGTTTRLASLQHSGVLAGMLLVTLACTVVGGRRLGSLRGWTIFGCLASALSLLGLGCAGLAAPEWPLKANAFVLGLSNGIFAVAAISSMMSLAGQGRESREGLRMGLWGAAQAIAFGCGGFLGAAASDIARHFVSSTGLAYSLVFCVEASLFVLSAAIAAKLGNGIEPVARPARLRIEESHA